MFNYLSLEAINSLLPKDLRIKNNKGTKYNIYPTESGGSIVATESKYLVKNGNYEEVFYSLFLDLAIKENITFISLTIHKEGILLIPNTVFLEIKDKLRTKAYNIGRGKSKQKQLRYNINARVEPNKIILFKAKEHFEMDLSQYFIPYIDENTIYVETNSYDLNKIYEEAKNFKDASTSYTFKDNVKRRIESQKQKERIAILENHTCQICGFRQPYINSNGKKRYIIEVDHIIEKSKGGGECIENLLVLCPNCHAKKTYGIITIDSNFRVYENGKEIKIRDNHLKKHI